MSHLPFHDASSVIGNDSNNDGNEQSGNANDGSISNSNNRINNDFVSPQQQLQQLQQELHLEAPPGSNMVAEQEEKHHKENVRAVQNLLSSEMMELSLQERNEIQEEIHGVKCLAPQETPELIERSLFELDAALNHIILTSPDETTNALLLARNQGNRTHTNSDDFKLRFLRCELFDVQRAAHHICQYLHRISSFFGNYALEREVYLHKDFSREELREFRKGCFQLLPFRDRSGRRILVIFPGEDIANMNTNLRAKIFYYFSTVAVAGDAETQRKGIVIVVWFDASYKIKTQRYLRSNPINDYSFWTGLRVAAIHVCTPDTPFFRFRQALIAVRVNKNNRSRLKLHGGEPVELFYSLRSYGIPTENIPVTWSGTVKNVYFKNWMKLRRAIEDDWEIQREARMMQLRTAGLASIPRGGYPRSSNQMSSVVDCPNSNDVVFRQGTSLYCHPGNVRFRSLVESTVVRLRESLTNTKDDKDDKNEDKGEDKSKEKFDRVDESVVEEDSISTSKLISEIIDRIVTKDRGRVLVWTPNHNNDKYGCWTTITDQDQIYAKIEYTVRAHIRGGGSSSTQAAGVSSKTEKQKSNLQTNESSTSIFRLKNAAPPSCSEVATNILVGAIAQPNGAIAQPTKRARMTSDVSSSGDEDNSCCFTGVRD